MKLNSTLRDTDTDRKGNNYVCCIFAAISGMVKLAEISPIPVSSRVPMRTLRQKLVLTWGCGTTRKGGWCIGQLRYQRMRLLGDLGD
eukprot:2203188-Rhodomonas_salina.2